VVVVVGWLVLVALESLLRRKERIHHHREQLMLSLLQPRNDSSRGRKEDVVLWSSNVECGGGKEDTEY
jgi:hypothetical protein